MELCSLTQHNSGRAANADTASTRYFPTRRAALRPYDEAREAAAGVRYVARSMQHDLSEHPPMSTQLLAAGLPVFSGFSAEHLLAVENELNQRPRMVLDDRSPAELFQALLASQNPSMLRR